MRRLVMFMVVAVVAVVAVPVALAQADAPPVDPIDWMAYAVIAINSLAVPIVADALKAYVKPIIPSFLLTFLPAVLGSALAIAEMSLFGVFGAEIPLDLIEQALLGGTGGLASSFGFKFGEVHGEKR